MPIYEYKCKQCGAQLELRQSVSDPPLTTCEKCHGQLEKQWSLSGFQFKGAGWYVTDYAGKNTDGSSAPDKPEKSSTDESTAKTEPASNTKAEPTPAPAADAGPKKESKKE